MIKKVFLFCILSLLPSLYSCDFLNELNDSFNSSDSTLTESDMVAGLKEALVVGSKTAAHTLNDTTGQIRIALPSDAEKAFTTVNRLANTSAGKTLLEVAGVDLPQYKTAMIRGLNRGAEHAAGLSVDVFKTAITNLTFGSASQILFGIDSLGATHYLDTTTSDVLTSGFKPIISSSFNAVKVQAFGNDYTVTGIWSEFAVRYNKVAGAFHTLKTTASSGNIVAAASASLSLKALSDAGVPSVDSLNTDIVNFATGKALDGLFFMVGKQELKIRRDPTAALEKITDFITKTASELIRKVFTSKQN
jgi:hypothetical protein